MECMRSIGNTGDNKPMQSQGPCLSIAWLVRPQSNHENSDAMRKDGQSKLPSEKRLLLDLLALKEMLGEDIDFTQLARDQCSPGAFVYDLCKHEDWSWGGDLLLT